MRVFARLGATLLLGASMLVSGCSCTTKPPPADPVLPSEANQTEPPAPADPEDNDPAVRIRPARMIEGNVPLTVTFPLDARLKAAILKVAHDDRDAPSLRIVLRQVDRPPANVSAADLFLDMPDANRDTSHDDPHYIGYFCWGIDWGRKESYIFGLNRPVRDLARAGKLDLDAPFTVTIVLEPDERMPDISRVRVGVEEVQLSAHPSR